ncbi:MAG: DUF882 domain-containing protein [bacterium]|nr:DUF882 domain-containing protein [bacterium]
MGGSCLIFSDKKVNRRELLKAGGLAAAALLIPEQALALGRTLSVERRLSLYNIHTGESLDRVYSSRGERQRASLSAINNIMRDHRSGEIVDIDTELLDTLYLLSQQLQCGSPFHIISAYRSPETNSMLRKSSSGVAKKSMHMYGKAVDVRLPGCNLEELRDAALQLKRGGVGYYPGSDFVHLDVGSYRYW